MIAGDVRDTDLAAYQRAARSLLVHPLVTPTVPDRDALGLVRRFSATLTRDFDELAGYRLELAPTCARLVRRIDRIDPTQRIVSRSRKPFDRRRYAYLCLVLGILGRAGSQVALTDLALALKRRAADVEGVGFDADNHRHRFAFIDVISHLESTGALHQVDASAVTWQKDPEAGDALYDVDRDVVHLTFVPPRVIQHLPSSASLLAVAAATSRDARRLELRQRLARLALEHPVVYLDDLDDAERSYLVGQGRTLGDDLARLTGGQLERRSEGVALIDATGGLSDRRFPTGGTPNQAALLLADAIADYAADPDGTTATVPSAASQTAATVARLDRARPASSMASPELIELEEPATGEPVASEPAGATSAFVSDAWLAAGATALCESHRRAFAEEFRDDPPALLRVAVQVLVDFDLVRHVPGGVVARPALARYRDLRVEVAAAPQLSLLETLPEPMP